MQINLMLNGVRVSDAMGRQSLPITFKLRQRINIGRISPFILIQQTP